MTKNVYILPTHRKAGRRRVRPMPDLALADVLTFETRGRLTPQEQLADCRATIDEIARGLLLTVRAVKVLDRKLESALSND